MDKVMTWKETRRLIEADYQRVQAECGRGGVIWFLGRIIFHPSFSVTFWLRVGNCLSSKKGLVCRLLLFVIKVIHKMNARMTGIQIPIGTNAAGGLKFCHFSSIVVAQYAVIGRNCSIHQGVTIGRVFAGRKAGTPTIGDHVVIFPGAKVVGNVRIGNNVVIGANAVVVDDVPDGVVVGGVPAKILSKDSSKCFEGNWVEYFGRTTSCC